MKGTIENEYNKPDQATMHPLLISFWKEFDDFCITQFISSTLLGFSKKGLRKSI